MKRAAILLLLLLSITAQAEISEVLAPQTDWETKIVDKLQQQKEERALADKLIIELELKKIIKEETKQEKISEQANAKIGEPVKWKKQIELSKTGKTRTQIPKAATNIELNAQFEIEETETKKELIISATETTHEIYYETPAPQKTEQTTPRGKKITVSSPDGTHYENVMAYTHIEQKIKDPSQIKILWEEYNTHIYPSKTEDTNNDGYYDYIEWIVPHLSTQNFEIVIITAEHLDSNRQYISNIYPEVKKLDGIWSEEIPNGNYVRVTFEKNLTSANDITIYPRIVSGNPKIEIYEKDGNQTIAEFTTINTNEYNKVFLSSLVGEQDTFDLRIVGGSVQFDHIIDPFALYKVQRGSAAMTVTNLNITIETVDPTKTFVLLSTRSGSSAPSVLQVTATLTNSTNLQLEKFSTTQTDIEWEVIQNPNFTVQRGAATTALATDTQILVDLPTAVNLNRSFITVTNRMNTGTANQNARGYWTAQFINTTRINLTRGETGTDATVSWQVVSIDSSNVQRGVFSSGSDVVNQTITQVNPNKTFLIFSNAVLGVTNLAGTQVRGVLADSQTITFTRQVTTGTIGVSWFAVEWDGFKVQRGQNSVTGTTPIDQTITPVSRMNETFHWHSKSSTGTGTTFANTYLTTRITNTTNIQFQKGATAQTQTVEWQVVEYLKPPETPVLHPEDGTNQIAFNNIRDNTTTPTFRASAVHDTTFNLFQLQISNASNFSGTIHVQNFTGTFNSGTQYNLIANNLTPNLPTTNGTTYYIRVRASADNGAVWSNWTTEGCCSIWSYTYRNAVELPDWHQTTNEQFSTGDLKGTQAANGQVSLAIIKATGGTIINGTGFRLHTFTTNSTFQVIEGTGNVQYLIVAGGGGGGGITNVNAGGGGGGGAGGMLTNVGGAGFPVAPQSYDVAVGAGGTAGIGGTSPGGNGGNSRFHNITATGGGGGASVGNNNGVTGGSGGGGRLTGIGAAGTAGQGNSGGNGSGGTALTAAAGGGGGRNTAGANATGNNGGNGGNGTQNNITGTPTFYAGGGGGGAYVGTGTGGAGGTGGGGTAPNTRGTGGNGTNGLGGGGAGATGSGSGAAFNGGVGGSGIVIIRYNIANGSIESTPINFSWVPNATSWGEARFTANETNGDIKLRILSNGTLIPDTDLPGNSAGFDGTINLSYLDPNVYSQISLLANFTEINGTAHLQDWTVTWRKNTPPIAENATLVSSLNTNTTDENLTATFDVFDADGDDIKNITNWKVNNTPIAVLNMPFEANAFNQNSEAKDYSENGNNGTNIGAIWNRTGGYDGFGAYEFNAANTIFTSDHASLNITDNLTITTWIKPRTTTPTQIILQKSTDLTNSNYAFALIGDELAFQYNSSAGNSQLLTTTTANIPVDAWTFAAVSVNTTNVTFYVNGTQIQSFTINETVVPRAGPITIGMANTISLFMNGTIDELHIWNRTLSEEQIQILFENNTLISSQETKIGDIWQACITPNDRREDGNETCSNNLTIVAPEGISIIPHVPEPGTQHKLTDELYIAAFAYDNNGIDTVNAEVILPNSSVEIVNLTNFEYAPDDETLLLLRLNEENGTEIEDKSFLKHNATLFGTGHTQNITGKFGNAIEFNATDGRIVIPHNSSMDFDETESFTLEAWVNGTNITGLMLAIAKVNVSETTPGYALLVDGAGQATLGLRNSTDTLLIAGTTNVFNGTYNHIAGTRNATTNECKIYVNGQLQTTQSCPPMDLTNNFNVTIGASIDAGLPFNGAIDDVRISNTIRENFAPDYYVNHYSANWTAIRQRGQYDIVIVANNTLGNIETHDTNFTRISHNVIDIITRHGTFNFPDRIAFLDYNTTITSNLSGVLNLTVDMANTQVGQIRIVNHDGNSINSIIKYINDNHTEENFFATYSIDPEGIDMESAILTANATGELLLKCGNYSVDLQDCLGEWEETMNLTRGDLYNVTINTTDPGFIETSAASDVALAPIDESTAIIGFVNTASPGTAQFNIQRTNGSVIVNTTTLADGIGTTSSRIDVAMLNETDFVFAIINGSSQTIIHQIWRFNGTDATNLTGHLTIEGTIGPNVDISVAALGDRYLICLINDSSNAARFLGFNNTGTGLFGPTNVDGRVGPSLPLQNLASCTGVAPNSSWTYFWYDNSPRVALRRVAYAQINSAGTITTAQTNIQSSVGATAQVAATTLDADKYAMLYYHATAQDIRLAVRDTANTVLLAPTTIAGGVGTESRVAATTIRENETSTQDHVVAVWWNNTATSIQAAVFNSTGGTITAPFTVTTAPNGTFRLIDATGRVPVTGNEICPGFFIVAFSNTSGQGEYLGFNINGTPWDGRCPVDLVALNISANNTNPNELENITINATVFNNATPTAYDFLVQIKQGSCETGTILVNTTVFNLTGGYNLTFETTLLATPVGPLNISLCVDPDERLNDTNRTNNNLTATFNVKAYNDYFGNLTGNVTLDTNLNETQYDWNFTDNGNVYFANSGVTINFNNLYALGRNTSGGIATNDFADADQALNMTGFNDSIQTLWATNASHPLQTANFTVRGRLIENVPYINSTNTSSFITGILWDASNSTNGEFDPTDSEPLVFIGNINRNQAGFYGTYDYEVHVPVLLRTYGSNTSALQFFVELR